MFPKLHQMLNTAFDEHTVTILYIAFLASCTSIW